MATVPRKRHKPAINIQFVVDDGCLVTPSAAKILHWISLLKGAADE
jgi:hypothetical protein